MFLERVAVEVAVTAWVPLVARRHRARRARSDSGLAGSEFAVWAWTVGASYGEREREQHRLGATAVADGASISSSIITWNVIPVPAQVNADALQGQGPHEQLMTQRTGSVAASGTHVVCCRHPGMLLQMQQACTVALARGMGC